MASKAPIRIVTLKKRADFLRLSKSGKKFATPVYLLLAAPNPIKDALEIRIGYTVTTKIGNAVVRNRVKRRFREAVRNIFPEHARTGVDYVLIARSKAPDVLFPDLIESLRFALIHLHKPQKKKLESTHET
jgi:ribonuclease P protein component